MTDATANNVLVETLSSAVRYGGAALADAPALLKRTLREEAWRQFRTQRGELVEPESFVAFVETPPLRGLGAGEGGEGVELVRRLLADDPEGLTLLDEALAMTPGYRSDLSNNIREVPRKQGTSREQALRRLKDQRPDLHAEVLAANITAHRAMVEAGFRRHTVSVPVDQPDSVAKSLRKHMSPEAIAQLKELL